MPVNVCDADRCVLEGGPEPGLAFSESAPGFDLISNHLAEQERAADPALTAPAFSLLTG
jgi:hypothetical protein